MWPIFKDINNLKLPLDYRIDINAVLTSMSFWSLGAIQSEIQHVLSRPRNRSGPDHQVTDISRIVVWNDSDKKLFARWV